MKIVISPSKSDIFSQILQGLQKFSTEINFNFSNEELYIQAMDASHCSIFDMKIKKEWFELFEVDDNNTMGMNVSILYRIFHTRESSQKIVLEMEENADKLNIDFENTDKTNKLAFPRSYEVPLMDLETDVLHIPECTYHVSFIMESKPFSALINQLASFGDALCLSCNVNNVFLETKGDDGNMKVDILLNDESYVEEVDIELAEEETLLYHYSIKFIENFCAFSKLTKVVKVNLQQDIPMKMEYEVDEYCIINLFLAPKIDD